MKRAERACALAERVTVVPLSVIAKGDAGALLPAKRR